MSEDWKYWIALSIVDGVGGVLTKKPVYQIPEC